MNRRNCSSKTINGGATAKKGEKILKMRMSLGDVTVLSDLSDNFAECPLI
jgi:hypothetical protein